MNALPAQSSFQDERFNDELMLLGTMLFYGDPAMCKTIMDIARPEHFQDLNLARVYTIISAGVEAGLKGFSLSQHVVAKLHNDPTLSEIGLRAQAFVAKLIIHAMPSIAAEGCARQVRHNHLRVLLDHSVKVGDSAESERLAAEMDALSKAHLSQGKAVEHISVAGNAVLERLSNTYQHGEIDNIAYPGSNDLQHAIGGFRPSLFYVIAGRPGMGKTTLAMSLLRKTAAKGHGVMVFSLEMSRDELIEVALCDVAWGPKSRIEYRTIRSGAKLGDSFPAIYEKLQDASEILNGLPIYITDAPGRTLADIRSAAIRQAQTFEAQGKRLEVICIDHLNLIKSSDRYAGNKVSETEEVSRGLKTLAKELGVAVVSLVQLNRGVEHREDKRPSLADLRGSGAIEEDADVVMFCYREAYYLAKPASDPSEDMARQAKLQEASSIIELSIAKQRAGECRTLKLFCDIGCGVVRDAA